MAKRSRKAPLPYWLQYAVDHQAQVLFMCDAICVVIFAVYCAFVIPGPLWSEAVRDMSAFSWVSSSPSFNLLLVLLTILAVAAAVLGLFGLKVASDELRMRRFSCLSCFITLLIELMALLTLTSVWATRPSVYRVVNLICQDTTVWGCEKHFIQAPARRLESPLRPDGRRLQPLFGPDGPEGRRLDSAAAATEFERWMRLERQENGEELFCRKVHHLCVEPHGFNFAQTCVCSGQWTVPDQTKASTVHSAPGHWLGSVGSYCENWGAKEPVVRWCYVSPTVNCTHGRKGVYSFSGQTFTRGDGPCGSAVETRSAVMMEAFEALDEPIVLSALLGASVFSLSLCAALLRTFPSRKTVWQRPPMQQTLAADTSEEDTLTSKGSRDPLYGRDPMQSGRSTGSSTDIEASPSAQGGFQGFMQSVARVVKPRPPQAGEMEELRFEEAQREAVRLLTDATPRDLKEMLYAYHMQAEEGDVRGQRPSALHPHERGNYDRWASFRGMGRGEAIQGYLRTVNLLQP